MIKGCVKVCACAWTCVAVGSSGANYSQLHVARVSTFLRTQAPTRPSPRLKELYVMHRRKIKPHGYKDSLQRFIRLSLCLPQILFYRKCLICFVGWIRSSLSLFPHRLQNFEITGSLCFCWKSFLHYSVHFETALSWAATVKTNEV